MGGQRNRWTQWAGRVVSPRSGRLLVIAFTVLLMLGTGLAFASEDQPGESTDPSLTSAPQGEPGPEIKADRTADSQTFKLPDGARETRIYESPVNYRDAEGEWQPIEEGLEQTGAGTITNGENGFDVQLPNRLGSGPVRVSLDQGWISSELLGPETEAASLSNGIASYEGPEAGTSFEFNSLANGLKENIEIADASQPSSFHFALEAAAGLTPTLAEDGSVQFRDEGGELVATLPAPVVSDASGPSEDPNAATYSLEVAGEGRWLLNVEVDREWLESPSRAWPVEIDPSVTVPTSLDCNIFNGSLEGTQLCGASGWPLIGAYAKYKLSGADEYARSLYRFNLSSIPKTAFVTKATMALHATGGGVKNTSGVEVRNVERPWASSATWTKYENRFNANWTTPGGDYGTTGATIEAATHGSSPWWEFSSSSITSLVGEWVSGAKENNGFLLKLTDEKTHQCGETSCTERIAEFSSSADANPSNRPYLSVAYYPAASSDSKLIAPAEGTRSAKRFKLQAKWSHQGVTGVFFQVKKSTGGWKEISASQVADKNGNPVSWPIAIEGGATESPPLYWNTGDVGIANQKMQIRAVLVGALEAEGYTPANSVELNRVSGGPKDATASVGPGSVDLLVGNFTTTRTDVSIPGFGSALEFSRSYSSRGTGKTPNSVLGAGWTPGAPVEEAGGAEWRSVRDVLPSAEEQEEGIGEYAILADLEGYEYAFELSGGVFITPPEMSGWALSSEAGNFVLRDPGGNTTTFSNGGSGSEYLPVSISQTGGSGNTTQMVYKIEGTSRRLTMIIAPTPAGITCTPANATATTGCHALEFAYKPATTWGGAESLGDRLAAITYYAFGNGGPWEVANYRYDTSGRLIAEWDPRISPALEETYTYSGGRLATLKPPGQEPWTLGYTKFSEVGGNDMRLTSVTRATLLASPTTAQTTIVYGVPLTGSGAPYDMSPTSVAQWGQQDIPVDATAIFPATEIPAKPPASYAKATIDYMDVEGQLVNTATPPGAGTTGASITTTETDEHGDVTRELGAQNRLRALAAGSESEKIAKSHELETKRIFSSDGTEMLEEWGPLHQVRLESGALTQARLHKIVQYDVGWPGTGLKPHLPTRETTGASIPGQGTDADQRVTETHYNWNLRKPTETIVDPGTGHLAIKSVTVYDETSGLPIQTRQPSNEGGGGAGTTKVVYYEAGGHANQECQATPRYANLPCKVLPAAQPGTPGQPELLVRSFLSYNQLGEPLETSESPGGGEANVRKTTTTYDAAGRELTKKIEGGGTAIPKVETLYSSTLGAPTTQKFVCESCDNQATTTGYDALGRPTTYEDADGNKAATTYDLLSRPATVDDGKGTQTLTYDATSGLLTKVEDSAGLSFTAAYDADGNIVERGLPGGITAKTTFNEADEPTKLAYTKLSNCGASCTWLEESLERSVYGQVMAETGTLANDQYSYDKAGRLTLAKETPTGGTCTTRAYSFEGSAGKDSNRTKLITRSAVGGACNTESGGTTQNYEYDSADRLLGSGIAYDSFGRITSLPAADAGGKTLTTSYFSDDMVATQTQGSITNAYQLDASLRQRQRIQGEGLEGTEIFHYAAPSDSLAWTQIGSSWKRNITGIGGELTAIQESSGTTTLQLTNLHGDVAATASTNPSETKLLATFRFDEFGNPTQEGTPRFGWLGGKGRRTELPSGVIQMGARSYVPEIGRFISTDPVQGGSANAYDYSDADPVNGLDLGGTKPYDISQIGDGTCHGDLHVYSFGNKFHAKFKVKCNAANYTFSVLKIQKYYQRHTTSGVSLPGHTFETIKSSEHQPSNASGPHWQKQWGNWNTKRGSTFDCTPDIEYQYRIDVVIRWNYKVPTPAGGDGEGADGGIGEEGGGTLELTAQQVCGKG